MNSQPLPVTIITGALEACQAGCGIDCSLPENQAEALAEVERKFSGRVKLTFCSALALDTCGLPSQLLDKVRSKVVALPLLVIKGKPCIAGYFDIRMMCTAVEAALEIDSD